MTAIRSEQAHHHRQRGVNPAGVRGVRLHTRAKITLPWLSQSIVPVARSLRQEHQALVLLRRGWLHGPHVDILVRGEPATPPSWNAIAAELDPGTPQRDHPVTLESYLRQAQELGRLEAVSPPYLPLRAHGAVELLADDPAATSLGRLKDAVLGALCTPVLRTIDELAVRPDAATERLVEAFVALAQTHYLGAGFGTYSFRSHVEAFLAWVAPSQDMRPVFAQRLVVDAPRLRPMVERQLSEHPSVSAATWRTALAYAAGTVDGAAASGVLTSDGLAELTPELDRSRMGPPGASDKVPLGDQPDSEFHRVVSESGVVDDPPVWFTGYRMLTNLFYQQLPLLTVSPLQRQYLCYAVAELVDEALGETWRERLLGAGTRPTEATGAQR